MVEPPLDMRGIAYDIKKPPFGDSLKWSWREVRSRPKKDLTIVDKRKVCFGFLFSIY